MGFGLVELECKQKSLVDCEREEEGGESSFMAMGGWLGREHQLIILLVSGGERTVLYFCVFVDEIVLQCAVEVRRGFGNFEICLWF